MLFSIIKNNISGGFMTIGTPSQLIFNASQSTVGAYFHCSAQAYKNKIALIDGSRTFTYQELDERSNRLANVFITMGLKPQDRVAILAHNCAEYIEAKLAAAKAGVILATQNYRLGDRELKHCIALVEPKLIITTTELNNNIVRLGMDNIPKMIIGDDYEQHLTTADSHYPDLTIDPESGLLILYTSGTTGLPKGALISHRALFARSLMFIAELSPPKNNIFIAWTPLSHMVSSDQSLGELMRGGTVYIVDGYQTDKLIEIIISQKMHWLVLVPGMVGAFIQECKKRKVKPKSIKYIGAMADLVPIDEIAEATTFFNAPYWNTFGATEAGIAPASGSFIAVGEKPLLLSKRQTAFCDVRLVDSEGNDVPDGQPGEASLKGPSLFSGYWNNDEVNSEDFRGGRFHMGDVLRRNEDGTLDYVDRVKYLIKSGGENIYPAEIETVIIMDKRVETAVAVRKPDNKWGEVPVLFVVRRDESLTAEIINALCKKELSSYKRPKEIYFINNDELPRSTTGKIQRHILEARFS